MVRRALIVTLIASCGLFTLASPTAAHTIKPVSPNQCVFNWTYPGENEKQIRCFSRYFGVDENKAVAVARCESGLRYNATSSGGHKGTWQYADSTWQGVLPHYFPGRHPSPYHGRAATIVTMRYVLHGGWSPWSCAG